MISLLGALVYRWRGMTGNPRPFTQAFFALPFALHAFYECLAWASVEEAAGIAGMVWVLTTLGTLTGHGRGIDLGDTDIGKPERLEFLIRWLHGRIPLYWYDALLLSITGLAITLPAGIATLNPFLAVSGALKGLCYAASKWGCPDRHTEAGELLTGAVLWGALL